jgi:predicted ribosomally synthesized peptide with nif11-like leader
VGGAGWAWWLWEWLCEEVLRDADRKVVAGLYREQHLPLLAMSEEQLSALLAKLKDDAGLQEKLKGAADLDTAVAMAKEAGFDVSKADWLRYQAKQTLELNDEELEGVAGGDSYRCMSGGMRTWHPREWYCNC